VFITNSSVHSHFSRISDNYRARKVVSATYGVLGIFNTIVNAYNNLPYEIKACNTVGTFRTRILDYLWNDFLGV